VSAALWCSGGSPSRWVDLNDNEEEISFLRMAVPTSGRIVRCEGPMAFFVDRINQIVGGQLGPSDVAELLDLESGRIDYGADDCPPPPKHLPGRG
jgi:hypothetical protein